MSQLSHRDHVNVISIPDSRLLYLSIMRLGAAKDTEITRIEPRWLVNWRHQTLQSGIVRPLESALLIVVDHLPRRFARFKLCAHFLDS